ncbi:hypothetical protein ACLK1Z_19785 [Escherichia coli]
MEVTEQVAESEKAQPEVEVVAQPEPVVEETPEPVAIEREELPLPEDVNAEAVSPEEWQAEAETVEIVEAAEEEAAKTNYRRRAGGTGAGCRSGRRGGKVVPPAERRAAGGRNRSGAGKTDQRRFLRAPKRSLLKTKENLASDLSAVPREKNRR